MRLPLILLLLIPTAFLHTQTLFPAKGGAERVRDFDITHYALFLNFDEQEHAVHGTTRITLTPLAGQVDSIVLDAVNMDIQAVSTQSGLALQYRSDSVSLTLFLAHSLQFRDTMTVSITYSCNPQHGLHFIQPDSSDMTRHWQIWTQGEESDNRHWFPCYDAPDDKATSEVIATVRDSYLVLSNGRLVGETEDRENRTRTFHWRQEKPHSSYLIMLAAGEYEILTDEEGDIPISHYVPLGESAKGLVSFQRTREILDGLTGIVNHPYPWNKYSQVVLYDFMWGGMENTSAVTLNEAYLYDRRADIDFSAEPVIAHEIAHQWWGDLVTARDWSHLWLHEGFANYYEGLYKREAFGTDEYQYEAYQWAKSIRRLDETAGRKPIVSHESFSVNLYQRGAWVLRMLSKLLGEEKLLEALTAFLREFGYEAVTTQDLVSFLEDYTDEDLGWFFDQWVYRAGYPVLEATTSWDEEGRLFRLTITQRQTIDSLTGLFRFPLGVEITTGTGVQRSEVYVDEGEEHFVIPLEEEPLMVIVDKGLNVLKSLKHEKSRDDYLYQLVHAKEAIDRLDACEGLASIEEENDVIGALSRAAGRDPFWAVRTKAINTLSGFEIEEGVEIFSGALADPDSRVRSAAVEALGSYPLPEVASVIERVSREDSSYLVLTSCIRALVRIDSSRGFALAAHYADMDSYRDMVRSASLNALRRLRDPRAIPIAIRFLGPTFETSVRLIAVGILEDTGKEDSTARATMAILARNANNRVRLAAVRALDAWGDETSKVVLRERREDETDPGIIEALDEALSRQP
jgi:aminopeptidase N